MLSSLASVLLSLWSAKVVAAPQLLVVQQQPDAPDPPKTQHRPLEWGSINFIHTTDVHVIHSKNEV